MIEAILVVLALLVVGLLCLPVRLALRWTRGADPPDQFLTVVTVLLGMIGVHLFREPSGWRLGPVIMGLRLPGIPLKSGTIPSASPDSAPAEAPSPAAPGHPRRPSRAWTRVRWQDWVTPTRRLLSALPGVIRLRRLRVHGSWGAGDPAQTGVVYGLLQATEWLRPSRLDLRVTPDFVSAGFRGDLELRLHLYPGLLAALVCRFLVHACWRALARRWRQVSRPRNTSAFTGRSIPASVVALTSCILPSIQSVRAPSWPGASARSVTQPISRTRH